MRNKRKGLREDVVRESTNTPEDVVLERLHCWESFFRCQKSPVLRSQVLTALMAGTPFAVLHLPNATLLDVLLLSTAARNECNAEIVDDYTTLVDRVREEWCKPDWTIRVFDSIHANKADYILQGASYFDNAEDAYIPRMTAWFLAHSVPTVFEKTIESVVSGKKNEKEPKVAKTVKRKKAA